MYLPLLLHAVQPDSTILFGVLVVGACLLMTRVLRDPRGARLLDPRLLAMGLLVGAAALTRNEALWVAMVWAWLAIRRSGSPLPERLRLIGVVAVVSLLVFAPWAARDWVVFGNPLPGQAVSNALSVTGFRHLRLERPPHPRALPRGRPGAARGRCALWAWPTTSSTSWFSWASRCR